MIPINELRKGNWVNVSHVHFKETEISTIQIDDLVRIFTNIPTYDYNPIPITEEWLLKFGFKNWATNDNCFIKKHIQLELIIFNDKTPVAKANNITGFYYFFNKEIQSLTFIHQLQNLYFALTGEELTLSVT
jgi:hypothetical protein